MSHAHIDTRRSVVVLHGDDGYTVIPSPDNQLTRLHYFDGKLLRAHDLEVEQRHLRALVALSNQGGGAGVVHGLDTTLSSGGATIDVGPGMAVDGQGRLLLVPGTISVGVAELIALSSSLRDTAEGGPRRAGEFRDCPPPAPDDGPDATTSVDGLYLITLAHAEALCGEEDVYGRLCEEACVTTTDRPYLLEGVVLRARRLSLGSPLPDSGAVALGPMHLRSRVASAYFADEASRVGSLISGAGLESRTFCLGGRNGDAAEVPLAVLARDGSSTQFLDAWTARRERMDAPAKRYWAWRLGMRPWDVYLAMVLQFQCQLRGLLEGGDAGPRDGDGCGPAVREAFEVVDKLARYYDDVVGVMDRMRSHPDLAGELDRLVFPGGRAGIESALQDLAASSRALSRRGGRRLVDGGIVELPPAGYLPVVPGSVPVERQVRALLGDGLDLRYCVVRPDFVPHAFEEAQHMERISLLQGLDDPSRKPEVDVLVPDGELVETVVGTEGAGVRGRLMLSQEELGQLAAGGLGRLVSTAEDGFEVRWVGSGAARAVPVEGEAEPAVPNTRFEEEFLWNEGEHFDPSIVEAASRAAAAARAVADTHAPVAAPPAPFFHGAEAPPMAMVAPPPAVEARLPTEGDAARTGGLYVRGRIDRNPFDLAFGEATDLLGRLVIAQPVQDGFLLDATVRGEFQLVNRMRAVDAMEGVSGRISGVLSGRMRRAGGELEPGSESFTLDAGLTIRRVDGRWAATLELGEAGSNAGDDRLVFDAAWNGTPVRVEIAGSISTEVRPFLRAVVQHDDDALRRPGDSRTLALRGLDLVSAVVEDGGFRSREEAWLFGRPEEGRTAVVRATRDWVLFHRRRTKVCARPEPRVEPRPRVRYRVVTPVVDLRDAVVTTHVAATTSVRFREIGSVEFHGGTASLATNAEALRNDWRAAAPGDVLVTAGIATHGETDPASLERARVRRVLEVLSGLVDVGGAAVQVEADVPPALDQPGYDGVIALIARTRPAEDTCHSVWWVPSEGMKDILSADGGGALGQWGTRLGDVTFRVDGHAVRDGGEEVAEAYAALPAHRPGAVFVVSQQGDESAGSDGLRTSRGRAIADAVGLTGANVRWVTVAWELPVDCPAVTIFFGDPIQVDVVPHEPEVVVVAERGGGHVEAVLDEPGLVLPFDESGVRVHEGRALELLERVRDAVDERGASRVTVVRPPSVDDGEWDRRRAEIETTLRERGVLAEDATVEVRDSLTARERRVIADRGDRPIVLVRIPGR